MSFGPIVRDSVGEDGAVAVECSRCNRAWGRIECFEERKKSISYAVGMTADKRTLQACASVFVPEVDGTIGA